MFIDRNHRHPIEIPKPYRVACIDDCVEGDEMYGVFGLWPGDVARVGEDGLRQHLVVRSLWLGNETWLALDESGFTYPLDDAHGLRPDRRGHLGRWRIEEGISEEEIQKNLIALAKQML